MFRLGDFFSNIIRDGEFRQTHFANTRMSGSLCYVAREKFLFQAKENPNVCCVIVPESLVDALPERIGVAVSNSPELDFYALHNQLVLTGQMVPEMSFQRSEDAQIHPSAVISPKTYIGSGVRIGPGVIVEDYSHIGDNVLIDSGAIIGASGHYYKQYGDKRFRVEHAGGVWLEEGVQILAGAVVSKSLHSDFTRVGKDTVVSIKAHVGHGCVIGKRCTLTGNVQVSGFTTLGDDVWVGPSATIGNLLNIGNNVRIDIGSVVVKDIPDGGRVSGNFAYNHRQHVRDYSQKIRGNN
ncbi:hypothetical protein D6779_01465 [Candidatus Parcubacteria bacterium]|nr:MAG: hypothetical protein D6779_01465 [Candidatus Parcubacteria bacterium]